MAEGGREGNMQVGDGGISNTVEVRGFSMRMSQELMEMYFENSRRSGGGDVEEVKIRDEVAYITFKEAEVAQKVASRSNHQVDGQTLTVTLFHPLPPKPCYQNRVLIQGFNNAITEELLRNFLESKMKAQVTEFLYGEEDGNVVVTFSDNIDIVQLGKIFQESSIEGVFLKVARVAISNCILVQNLHPSTSHDVILYYFENKRRSGGGDVERVEMKTEDRYCLIYFEDPSVIDRVLGQSHNVDGVDFEIHLHHECLGRRSSRKKSDLFLRMSSPGNKDSATLEDENTDNQPKDKTSSSVSSNPEKESDFVEVQEWQENDGNNCTLPLCIKYKRAPDRKIIKCMKNIPCSWNFHLYWNFYTKTEPGKQMLHEILNKYNCSVAMFAEDEDLFIFEISEKIFEQESDVVQLINVVLDSVYKCAQQYLYLDNLLVDQRIQGDVLQVVRQRKELDIARFELMGQQDFDALCVICIEKDQTLVLDVVTEIIHMVKECFENHEEIIDVDHKWQKVMNTFGYLQKLYEKYPSVTIISDKTKPAIMLKGPRDQSKPAADHFLELLGTVSSEVQEEIFSPGCQFEIFTYPEMCGYIDNITMELSIVWIPNHQTKKIHLFSKKSENIKVVDKLIRSCVQERLYPLAKDQTVFSTKIFRSLEELKKMHTGKIVFSSSDKGLLLTTSDDIFKSIDDAVQEIICKETELQISRVHEEAEGDRTKTTIAERGQFSKQSNENDDQADTTKPLEAGKEQRGNNAMSTDTVPLKAILPGKEHHKSTELQYSSEKQYCILVCDVKEEDARSLEGHIKSFGFTVKFVYPCKVGEALVICTNSKDKNTLLKKLKQWYKVQSVSLQKIQGFTAAVDPLIATKVRKVMKKQDTVERQSEINISHTERSNLFEAVSSKHHEIFVKETPEIKVQKRSSENSVSEDIENNKLIENVSQTEFLALKSLEVYSKWTQKFNIKFTYDKETLYAQGDLLYLNEEMKKEIEKEIAALRGKQKTELLYDPREIMQFRSAVDEAKSDELLLVWDDPNKQVLVYSDNYDDMQKFKHRVEFKMGKKKPTGRSGRRFAKLEVTQPLLSEEESPTKKKIARSFSWSQDATNVEVFKTLEGIMVKVYKANILKLDVDCIVNAANDNLQHGGGVALVIAKGAGPEIDREGSEILKIRGRINVGEQCVTTAGNLPYDCVIHTVGPRWSDYYPHDARNIARCETDLFNSILGCFIEAEKHHLKSIALPAISSGIFAVPRDVYTEQYAKAVIYYSKTRTSLDLQEIHFIDMLPDIVKDMQLAFKRHLSYDGNAKHIVNSGDQTPAINNQAGGDHGNNQHDTIPEKDIGAASPTEEKQNLAPVFPKFEEKIVKEQKFHVYRPNQNMAVYICTTDITKLTGVKAVVCSDDVGGNGYGAVASALLQIGKSKYKSVKKKAFEKDIRFGDVIVTSGGDSNFDLVIHAVLPSFKDKISPQKHRELVRICYDKILDDINNWGKASLALPFIGTGCAELGYEGSAKLFLDSLEVFCQRATTVNIKVIYIVEKDKHTTEKIADVFSKHTDRVRRNLLATHDNVSKSAWHPSSHTSSVGPQGEISQKIQGFTAAVDPLIATKVRKVMKKQDTVERQSEINISHTERSNLFEAVSSKHHEIFVKETPEIKVQKRSSENSVSEDIENNKLIENVSQTEFLALKSLEVYSKWTQKFNIKFTYDKETLYAQGDLLYLNEEMKKEIEKEIAALRGKQKTELSYDPREIMQFRSAVDEAKSDELLLVWDDDNKQVLVYSDSFDDMLKFKCKVEFKMGKKKLTSRSGRRFAKQEDTMPLLSEEESPTKKKISRSFSWSQDATNVEVFKTLEGIMVKVYKANILKLDVDCIVNAANDNLQHGSGVALVIAKGAGPEIDREGSEILKIRGRINVGEQCVTTAGNLPYDCVIHTVGPRWSDYYPHDARNIARCETDLFNSIIGCFIEAEKRHLKSIALPAISSEIFAVPRDVCTEQYAKAVIHYSKTRTSLVLQEIHFIDMVPGIVKDMQLAFKRHLGCDGNAKHIVNSGDQTPAINNQAGGDHGNNQHDTIPEKDIGAASPTEEKQNLAPVFPKFEEKIVKEQKFHVYRPNQNMAVYICTTDITKLTGVKAVVCSDDVGGNGYGAVASALLQIGKSKYKRVKKKAFEKDIRFGDVIVTSGGDSNFDLVIHAVLPSFKDKISPQKHRELVRICYDKILDDTNNWGKASLALPFIGTGCAELGYEGSAKLFLDSLEVFCQRATTVNIKVIYIVEKDKHTTEKIADVFTLIESEEIYWQHMIMCRNQHGIHLHIPVLLDLKEKYPSLIDLVTSVRVKPKTPVSGALSKEDCHICLNKVKSPKTLNCGHTFCIKCIESKPACPTCGAFHGIIYGDQPEGGEMKVTVLQFSLKGFERRDTLKIEYGIPRGKQGPNHPEPGKWFDSIYQTAYLPDTTEGKKVCNLLRVAFERRLIFTFHRSSWGVGHVLTWNDIHHKTTLSGGQYGYPDSGYLQRVQEQLAAKGITEADIKLETAL